MHSAGGTAQQARFFLHNAISSLYKRSASRDLADMPRLILSVCAGLTVFGMVLSSSVSMISQGCPFSQVTRQVMFAAPRRRIRGYSSDESTAVPQMWVVNILLALAILALAVLAIGTDINSSNWIGFSIQIQPSNSLNSLLCCGRGLDSARQ